jgi:large subunit ribosomal protein L29
VKATEIRDLSEAEVRDRLNQVQEELFRLRFRAATQPLENPALFKALKKDLARLNTIIRERELADANG